MNLKPYLPRWFVTTLMGLWFLSGPAAAEGKGGTSYGDFLTTLFLVNHNYNFSYYNPGRLPLFRQSEVYFQRSVMPGGSEFYYGALNYLVGTEGTASFSWIRFGLDNIKQRDDNGNMTGSFSDTYNAFFLSYAHRLFPYLSLGTNLKVANRSFYNDSDYGFGMDAGLVLIPTQFRFFDNISLDFNLQNLVRPILSYDFGVKAEEIWPRNLRSNFIASFLDGHLDLGFSANVINIFSQDQVTTGYRRFSFDYTATFRPTDLIAVMSGYNNQTVRLGWMLGYNGTEELNLMTTYNKFWGYSTHLSFSHRFGQTREEKLLIKRARAGRFKARQTLQEAMALYNTGKYLDAVFKFKEVILIFPRFESADQAYYYLALCYHELGLPFGTEKTLEKMVKDYPASPLIPEALKYLARVYASRDKLGDLNATYQKLKDRYPHHPSRDAAAYQLGQYLFTHQSGTDALELFTSIPDTSLYYHLAQYFCANYYLQQDSVEKAFSHLDNIMTRQPERPRIVNLAARARIARAHCYFESAQYDSALACYQKVKPGSTFYAQALLGAGWSYYHKGDYQKTIEMLEKLLPRLTPDDPYYYEVRFIIAQSYYLLNDYAKARDLFNSFITFAISDSISALTDTTGRGKELADLALEQDEKLADDISRFDKELFDLAFYKPLPSRQYEKYTAGRKRLRQVREARARAQRAIKLPNTMAVWLANVYEMAPKAGRAVTESRMYDAYMKYTPRIRELEKRLYDVEPPVPEEMEPEEDIPGPDIDIDVEMLNEEEKQEIEKSIEK